MPHLSFDLMTTLTPALREEILDLWCRVNDAGGAVGFSVGAPRASVATALAAHEAEMAAGGAWFVPAYADRELAGFAWWVTGTNPLFRHVAIAKRLMTDPSRRGQGIGRALMDELHRVAAALPGVELLMLQYRTGLGLGKWYASLGYTETARAARTIKLPGGDYRGSVTMMRTLDGSPLPVDERR